MRSILHFLVVVLSTVVAFAEDQFTAEAYATQANQLLSKCKSSNVSTIQDSLYVIFLRGNAIFDGLNNSSAGDLWLETVKELAEKRNYKVLATENLWWAWQKGVCRRIIEANPTKIIVAGHSAGSNGSRFLAQCLKEANRKIDVLTTFAAFDYDLQVSEENVTTHFNYIMKTVYLQGSEKTPYGSNKTLNYFTKSTSARWAHIYGTTYLAPLFALQTIAEIEGLSDQLVIPNGFVAETAQTNLQDFINCKN